VKGQTRKRNIQRISEQDPVDRYQSLHHFISHSSWDTDSIKLIMQHVNKDLLSDRSYGYIIDERSQAKKGNHSIGVGRQYCGSTGKIDNCQTGVYSVLTTGEITLPNNFRLYLPTDWISNKKDHKTKVDLAMDMIREDRKNGIHPQWYGADSLYGRAWKLTSYIEDECRAYFVMDTTKDQLIYLSNPTDRRRKPITIEKYLQQIRLSSAKTICYQGNKKAKTHIAEIFTRDTKQDKHPRKRLLIISRGQSKRDKIKFSLTNFTLNQKSPAQLVFMQRARFTVEQYFREACQIAGMGDYQVRCFMGWRHVQILTMLLMQSLNLIRIKLTKQRLFISVIAVSRCLNLILLNVRYQKQLVANVIRNCTFDPNSS